MGAALLYGREGRGGSFWRLAFRGGMEWKWNGNGMEMEMEMNAIRRCNE